MKDIFKKISKEKFEANILAEYKKAVEVRIKVDEWVKLNAKHLCKPTQDYFLKAGVITKEDLDQHGKQQ